MKKKATVKKMQDHSEYFYRCSDDKVIGGVCSGLAHYFGISSFVVRALFVVLALFGGPGLFLAVVCMYLVAWFIVPLDKELFAHHHEHTSRRHAHFSPSWYFGFFLVIFGIVFLFEGKFYWLRFGHVLFPLGLLAAGFFLLYKRCQK